MIAFTFAASMCFYVERILIPYQEADAAAQGRPRGNLSDLYPRWLGARELLLHGRDPYSAEVTREIQVGYYGRVLDASRPHDPLDQQAFAYPLYVAFLLAPTITLPFAIVHTAFLWFLLALVPATVVLWLFTLRWRPSTSAVVVLIVLTLGSFPAVQGIKLQQLTLLVCGLIAGCAALLVSGHLFFAGVLLALATIKPQLTFLIAGWLLIWAFSKSERLAFVWGFIGTLTGLVLLAEYVLPGWIPRFVHGLIAYERYTGGGRSLLDVLTTPVAGKLISAGLVVVCGFGAWQLRKRGASTERFSFVLALVLALTVVIVPTFAPYNQLLLLPGIILLAQNWDALWQKRTMRLAVIAVGVLVLWPWLMTLGLTFMSVIFKPASLEGAWALPLYTSLAIPISVLAALILYSRLVTFQPAVAASAQCAETGIMG